MNVKDLIEHLQKYPDDMEVRAHGRNVTKSGKELQINIPKKILMVNNKNGRFHNMPVANMAHLEYIGYSLGDGYVKEVLWI